MIDVVVDGGGNNAIDAGLEGGNGSVLMQKLDVHHVVVLLASLSGKKSEPNAGRFQHRRKRCRLCVVIVVDDFWFGVSRWSMVTEV